MTKLIIILLSAVFINNYVLSRFLGICPFLGVSKKLDSATGMSLAVIFVMLMATAATYPIQIYLLNPNGLGYLQTIVFILVIAALVQLVEIVLKRFVPSLHKSLGVYLPLITTNCAVLGVTILNIDEGYTFLEAMVNSLGSGLGFFLAMVMFSGVRSVLEKADVPKSFKGLPITLVAAAIVSLSFLGAVLVIAAKVMAVKEDERFPAVRECLPGANCGACGFAGCDGYAKALCENPDTPTNLCIPGADGVSRQLSDILGVEFADVVEQVAVVHCSGDCEHTSDKVVYQGIESCAAAKLMYGGKGSCTYGCLGLGDCVKVCPHDAICIADGVARVNTKDCVGCGLCAKTCPNHLISLVADVERVVVACSNKDKGAVTRKVCSNGCIGCKKCEKVCPLGAIKVVDNVAVIDYEKCDNCPDFAVCAKNCTVGCILTADLSGMHRVK